MGIRVINAKANFSKVAVTGLKRDITSGAVDLSGVISPEGKNLNSTYFITKQLNVSNYRGKTIEFTFIKYTSSGGADGTYGCGFYDASGNFTLIKANEHSGTNSTGLIDIVTNITIPDNAVTMKTVWFSEAAESNGIYSGSIEDFYIYLIE